jgi:hypothetical protein
MGRSPGLRRSWSGSPTRVLHVGDFAIWPDRGGHVFLDRVDALAEATGIRIAVTPWWVDEVPTEADVERVSLGGFAEIMVLHDSPDPGTASVNMIREYPSGWPADARQYARAGVQRITEAWQAVQPTLTVHGHFHVRGEITLPTGQRIVSLAEETTAGNVLLLNLHTLETTWLENLQ